jgi:hypothetical protein
MSPRPPPADFHGQPLYLPGITIHPGKLPSRGISKGSLVFTHRRFPSPAATGWNSSPWAFPWASHPAVTSRARQGGDRSRTLTENHVSGITRTSNQRTHSTRATSCRSPFRQKGAWPGRRLAPRLCGRRGRFPWSRLGLPGRSRAAGCPGIADRANRRAPRSSGSKSGRTWWPGGHRATEGELASGHRC